MDVVKRPVHCYSCKAFVDIYTFDPLREELTLFGWIGVGWSPTPATNVTFFMLGIKCDRCG